MCDDPDVLAKQSTEIAIIQLRALVLLLDTDVMASSHDSILK